MKTVKLSTFDPTAISLSSFGNSISEVSYDGVSGIVTLHYTDQTTKDLPTIKPGVIKNIVSAQLIGSDLTINFDTGSPIVITDVSDTYQVTYPDIIGSGILTDASTGQHKTLVSTDPDLTIGVVGNELQVSATVTGSGGSTDNALSPFVMSDFRLKVSGSAGINRTASTADTYHRRLFSDIVSNFANIAYVDGVFTFPAGTYYVDCKTTASQTGLSFLVLRKISDQSELLSGTAVNAAAASAQNMDLHMSGYVSFTAPTDVEIVQYCELAAVGGLVQVDLAPLFDLEAEVANLSIFKVSSTVSTPAPVTQPTEPSLVTALKNMTAQYGDRTPTEVKLFDEIRAAGWSSTTRSGDFVFALCSDSGTILKWNTLDDSVVFIRIPEITANSHISIIAVGNTVYIIPYTDTSVGLLDVTTNLYSFTDFGVSLSGASKWSDAVFCPLTNNIYCIPASSNTFLIIDTVGQTASRSNLGATLSTASNKFMGGVYAEGKIYCIPHSATDIVVIDTVGGTASNTTYGLTLSDANKWWGGFYVPAQQKVVGIPHSATDLLIIDVVAGTAQRNALGATLTGNTKWKSAYGTDSSGVVYVFPGFSARDVLKVDLATNSATRIAQHHSFPSSGLFNSAVQINNDLYMCNYQYSDNLVKIKMDTLVPTYVDYGRIFINSATSTIFHGMIRARNDVVYCVPAASYDCFAVDPINDRITRLPPPNTIAVSTTLFYDGAVDLEGNVWFCPYSGVDVCRIIPADAQGTKRELVGRKQLNLVPLMTSNSQDGYVITASSQAAGYESYKAFNREFGTQALTWQSSTAVEDKWIQVQLPAPKRIHGVRFRQGHIGFLRKGVVKGSVNGTDWVNLVNVESNSSITNELSGLYLINNVTEFNYLRLDITEHDTTTAALAELWFMEDDVGAEMLYEVLYDTNTGSCPHQRVTASSVLSASYPAHRVTRQHRGVTVTDGWASSATAGPHWLDFDLKSAVRVTSIALWVLNAEYPDRVILQGSNDGVTYDELADIALPAASATYCDLGEYYFTNLTAYKRYRLIAYGIGGNGVRLGKVSLRTPDEYDADNWWGRWDVVRWPSNASFSGTAKWAGAATDPATGKVYLIPHTSTDIGIIDPVNKTLERTTLKLPGIVGSTKYIGGAFSPYDGKLYCVPFTTVGFLAIDTANGKYEQSYVNANLGQQFNHSFATLGGDGNIYCSTRNQYAPAIVFTEIGAVTTAFGTHLTGSDKYRGISLGPNGKLYQIPYTRNTYGEISLESYEVRDIPTLDTSTQTSAVGSALLSNGMILVGKYGSGTEVNKSCFYALDFGPGITIPAEIIDHTSVR